MDKYGYDPREAACDWVVKNLDYMESMIPRSFPRVVVSQESFASDPWFVATWIVSLGALSLVLVSALMTFRQRNSLAVRRAQVEFLWLLLIGLGLVCVGSVFLIQAPTDLSCVLSVWLVNFGYTLELVPLLVKMAAINRIMSAASRMKRVILKMSDLFRIVTFVVGAVVVALTLWTWFDPPRNTINYELTNSLNELGETVVTTTSLCASESDRWIHASLCWHALLLLMATVLAFQTRKMPQDVNESHVLALMIYSHFVFVLLRGVTVFLDVIDRSVVPLYLCILLSLDATITCLIYFVPKFLAVDPLQDADMSSGAVFGNTHTNGGSTLSGNAKGSMLCGHDRSSFTKKHPRTSSWGHGHLSSQNSPVSRRSKMKSLLSEMGYDVSESDAGCLNESGDNLVLPDSSTQEQKSSALGHALPSPEDTTTARISEETKSEEAVEGCNGASAETADFCLDETLEHANGATESDDDSLGSKGVMAFL